MTTFYCFESQGAFVALGGKPQSEYTVDGVGVSVIGEHYEPDPDPLPDDYEPVFIGYLVNTTEPVEAWSAAEVQPTSPMRIFG